MNTDTDRIAYLEKELIKERYGGEINHEMQRLNQELPIGTSLQVIFDQAFSIVKDRHPI